MLGDGANCPRAALRVTDDTDVVCIDPAVKHAVPWCIQHEIERDRGCFACSGLPVFGADDNKAPRGETLEEGLVHACLGVAAVDHHNHRIPCAIVLELLWIPRADLADDRFFNGELGIRHVLAAAPRVLLLERSGAGKALVVVIVEQGLGCVDLLLDNKKHHDGNQGNDYRSDGDAGSLQDFLHAPSPGSVRAGLAVQFRPAQRDQR